ncbi:Solute carrier 49 member 4 [Branchiostoma belcheri]|nr:Solute carrier 49 member 4 [Branchiostoma belcheri]
MYGKERILAKPRFVNQTQPIEDGPPNIKMEGNDRQQANKDNITRLTNLENTTSSANVVRTVEPQTSMFASAERLPKNGSFWLVCLSYGMVQGSIGGWGNILDVNVSPYNVTQVQAGWVGFYGNLIGCAFSFVFARLGDYFAGHFKLMLVLLAVLQAATMLWFILMVNVSLIPFSMASLYTTFALTQVCLSGSGPIYYEMSVEMTHPVAEGITTIVLTLVYYIFCLLVLLLPMVPALGVAWLNWATLGTTFVVLPMLCCFRERYGRLSIDVAGVKEQGGTTETLNSTRAPLTTRRRDLIVRTPGGTPPVAGIPPGHISYVTDQMNRIKTMPARLLNPAGASRGYIPDGHRQTCRALCGRVTRGDGRDDTASAPGRRNNGVTLASNVAR